MTGQTDHEKAIEAVAAKLRSPSTFPGETATAVARELIDAYLKARNAEPVAWTMKDSYGCDYITMSCAQAESWPAKTPLFAALASPSPVPHMLGWEAEEKLTVEQAWTILCETPDVTSPEEYPDHALITMEQLGSFMARARHHGMAWEPIETAPRDGTVILLCGGAYHGYPFSGKWDLGPFTDTDRPWLNVINESRLYEHVPTRWMPLPAQPALATPEGGE